VFRQDPQSAGSAVPGSKKVRSGHPVRNPPFSSSFVDTGSQIVVVSILRNSTSGRLSRRSELVGFAVCRRRRLAIAFVELNQSQDRYDTTDHRENKNSNHYVPVLRETINIPT
jgi:hypothetical protein